MYVKYRGVRPSTIENWYDKGAGLPLAVIPSSGYCNQFERKPLTLSSKDVEVILCSDFDSWGRRPQIHLRAPVPHLISQTWSRTWFHRFWLKIHSCQWGSEDPTNQVFFIFLPGLVRKMPAPISPYPTDRQTDRQTDSRGRFAGLYQPWLGIEDWICNISSSGHVQE